MNNTEQKIEYVKDSFAEYLGLKERISASDIKNFLSSPRYFFYKKFEEEKKDATERHFVIGSALHELILEPEFFKNNYLVTPKFDMRTNVGKTAHAEFLESANGKVLLNIDEYELIVKMGESASKNETFLELIWDSYRELSCYTTDEKTGLKLRLRPDSFAKTKSTIQADDMGIHANGDTPSIPFNVDPKHVCQQLGMNRKEGFWVMSQDEYF
jgi:hypothetical protein